MIIDINRSGEISLINAEDFKSLKACADGEVLDAGILLRVFEGLGSVDADMKHVWIAPDAFVSRLAAGQDEQWLARFNAMVAGAAKYGFVDADTGAVRAHIERRDSV